MSKPLLKRLNDKLEALNDKYEGETAVSPTTYNVAVPSAAYGAYAMSLVFLFVKYNDKLHIAEVTHPMFFVLFWVFLALAILAGVLFVHITVLPPLRLLVAYSRMAIRKIKRTGSEAK